MGKRKFKTDLLPSFVAILVAIAAIAVSIWQGMETRKHNRLSVKPKLQFIFRADPQGDASIILTNDGLGPATIKNFDILLDGKPVSDSRVMSIASLPDHIGLKGVPFTFDPILAITLRSGAQLKVIEYKSSEVPNMRQVVDSLVKYLNRIDLKVEYESMYEERFNIDF